MRSRGRRLRFIYNELDLLLAEATERGFLWGLDPAEFAAFCSGFVYEPRREDPGIPAWPTARLAERWEAAKAMGDKMLADGTLDGLWLLLDAGEASAAT